MNNESLLQNITKFYQHFTKIKLQFQEKVASSGFHYKER